LNPCYSSAEKVKVQEDTGRAATFNKMLRHCGVNPKKLEKQLKDVELSDMARKINFDWKACARKFGVSSTAIEDIETENYQKIKEQRYKALQKWKQLRSFEATGKAFVEVLINIDEVDQAKEVCLLLK